NLPYSPVMNLERRGAKWRARVFVRGVRESATFTTKAQAVAWGQQREAELAGAKLPDRSVGDALKRYAREVAPTHKGEKWEKVRLAMMGRDPLARVRLPALRPSDIADWKQRRLKVVSGASVRREMNLLQSMFGVARKEWG